MTEHGVLPQRGLEKKPFPVPIRGDDPDPVLTAALRGPVGDVVTLELHGASRNLLDTHECVDQFALTVAFDPGDPDDLSLVDVESDVVENGPSIFGECRYPLDREFDDVGNRRLGGLGGRKFRTHHELGELLRIDIGRFDGCHGAPSTHNRDRVSDRQHFIEVVRDEDDRFAFRFELSEAVEELVNFLRHEDRGRFVEDEDLRTAIEDLHDLGALPGPDRQCFDESIRFDVHAVRRPDLVDLVPSGGVVELRALGGFRSQDDVLEHREIVGEHEMLMHHADPFVDRILR